MTNDENEVIVEFTVDAKRLSWPEELALSTDDYFVRGYQDMRGLTWDDARDTLILEKDLIERYPGDLNDAWESIVENEEEYTLGFYGLDLGVASAAVALAAANCAPYTNCNGASGHHEAYPLVAFYCHKGRVRDILKAAETANCGLYNDESGSLVLYAGNVEPLMRFAEILIERRGSLRPLSSPNRKKYPRKRDNRQLSFDMPQ